MATTAIDTLRFARKLKAAGLPDDQAEAMATALGEEYILTMLDGARHPKDMDRPGLRLHPLKRQSPRAVECVGVGKLAHRLPLRMG